MINISKEIANLAWYDLINKLKRILEFFNIKLNSFEAPIDGNQYGRQDGGWTEIIGGSGGVQSVNGDIVNNADPSNPIINTPSLQQVGDVDEFVWLDAGGNNIASVGSTTGGLDSVFLAATDSTALVQKSGSVIAGSTGFRLESTIDDTSKIAIAGEAVIGKDLNFEVDNTLASGNYKLAVKQDVFDTKTIIEIDALILANGLVPGATYKITGVHPTLYDDGTTSGTAIYLQALTTNILSKEGHGEFWNPKYDNTIDDGGVWNNVSVLEASNIVGVFNKGEAITANNGATGVLLNYIQDGLYVDSGSGFFWDTAISITGDVSGATANVFVNIDNRKLGANPIGSKKIHGGYTWINLTGNLGTEVDLFTLDNVNWSKLPYTNTDYNFALDIIEYDYTNDWISRRYEVEGNNNVVFTIKDNLYFQDNVNGSTVTTSAINQFQFGNIYDPSEPFGLGNNNVISSTFTCLNWIMTNAINNIIQGHSYMTENTKFISIDKNREFNGNIITNVGFIDTIVHTYGFINNNLYDIEFNTIFLCQSDIVDNTINGGSFSDISFTNTIYSNNILKDSNLQDVTLFLGNIGRNTTNATTFAHITSTAFQMDLNVFDNGTISNIISDYVKINYSRGNLFLLDFLNLNYTNKEIISTNFDNVTINIDLTAATLIFSTINTKHIYTRGDNVIRLQYYNNSDVLTFADITD
jgi:hypothetical protein